MGLWNSGKDLCQRCRRGRPVVILVTLYFTIKLHFKNNRISKEEDFIDLYEKRRIHSDM